MPILYAKSHSCMGGGANPHLAVLLRLSEELADLGFGQAGRGAQEVRHRGRVQVVRQEPALRQQLQPLVRARMM